MESYSKEGKWVLQQRTRRMLFVFVGFSLLMTILVMNWVLNNAIYVAEGSQSPDEQMETVVYFGAGCFWHVQHEFVEAERIILKRSFDDITSLVGYAGGSKTGEGGLVCYHNKYNLAEYGSLGHAEVVGMRIPKWSFKRFAQVYISLLDGNGDRTDKGDKGGEYRSLVGLPGGWSSALRPVLEDEARKKKGVQLREGRGDDEDTLGTGVVWVMDSNKFPFVQGEIYHQFHDGLTRAEQYPDGYNDLVHIAIQTGKIQNTGCPEKNNRRPSRQALPPRPPPDDLQ